jgi:hypothetical protein
MTTRTHRRSRRISLASPAETMPLLKAAATRMGAGDVLVALLDDHRRLVELLPVASDDDELPELARVLAGAPAPVRAVIVATPRPNVVPADKPEDEPRWEEMQAAFADSPVTLLDWFVICGERWVWSVAEHAQTPAQW